MNWVDAATRVGPLIVGLVSVVGSLWWGRQVVKARDAQLRVKDTEVAAKDGQLQAKDAELAAKDGELRAKDGELRAKDAELAAKDGLLKVKETELAVYSAPRLLEHYEAVKSLSSALYQEQREVVERRVDYDIKLSKMRFIEGLSLGLRKTMPADDPADESSEVKGEEGG